MAVSGACPVTSEGEFDRKVAVAAVVFLAVFELGYFFLSSPPYDALGYLIGRDFVNTWMGARSALAGNPAAWFDFDAYNAALRTQFGAGFPDHIWSYPPHLLLFTWPLGYLPYLPAFAVWCAVGFALYMLVASAGERRPDRLLLLAAAPALVINVFSGQIGFFTTALMIGGLTQLDRRPILAGMLFGILTIKPQLGLLLPVMLLVTGRWITIAAAVATATVLVAATAWVFGPHIWSDYLNVALPAHVPALTQGGGIVPAMIPTVFMNARIAGAPSSLAGALQGVMSCLAVSAVVWAYWRRRDPVLSLALFVTASFLATPYAFGYDMLVFGWVLATLRERGPGDTIDQWLAVAVWTLPITTILLGVAGVPGSSLALAAFAGRLVWRLARREPEPRPADLRLANFAISAD